MFRFLCGRKFSFHLHKSQGVWLLDHIIRVCFVLYGKPPNCLQSDCAMWYFLQQWIGIPIFPYLRQHLALPSSTKALIVSSFINSFIRWLSSMRSFKKYLLSTCNRPHCSRCWRQNSETIVSRSRLHLLAPDDKWWWRWWQWLMSDSLLWRSLCALTQRRYRYNYPRLIDEITKAERGRATCQGHAARYDGPGSPTQVVWLIIVRLAVQV